MYTLSIEHIILLLVMIAVIGFVIGWFLRDIANKEPSDILGTIHVELSDPDGPYTWLEFESQSQADALMRSKTALLKIDTESYLKKGKRK